VKIAIVIERLEGWRGGAETSTLEIARLLVARGHEVHVITSTNVQSRPDMAIHRIKAATVLAPLRTATFVRNAEAFLRGHSFDVVHAIAPIPTADVYQPRGGLLRETIERNVAMRRSASRRFLKRALLAMNVKQRTLLELEGRTFARGGPVIAAVSQYVARQCERFYDARPPRVRVIYNGVSTILPSPADRAGQRRDIRRQYHLDDATLVLLFIAHNFRLKGLYPLIDALALLRRSGFEAFRLLIVGRDNPAPFQRRLNALGMSRFATFTGPTQRSSAFYLAADALVHPTYYDPCSRVVLEALSHGLPCITSRFNGASEVITDGREGFLIESPDEIEALARCIGELRSAERRREMGQHALRLRSIVSMDRHVEELEALYAAVREARGKCIRSA